MPSRKTTAKIEGLPPAGRIGLRVMAIIFVVAGIVLICISINAFRVATQSKSWPTTEGIILDSATRLADPIKPAGNIVLDIKYSYSVNGKTLVGGRIANIKDTYLPHRNDELLREYAPGKKILVYYDPNDPSSALLEPGGHFSAFFLLLNAPILIVIGGALWNYTRTPSAMATRRNSRRRSKE